MGVVLEGPDASYHSATATAEAIEAVDEVEHSVAAERVGLFYGAGHRRDALVDAAALFKRS